MPLTVPEVGSGGAVGAGRISRRAVVRAGLAAGGALAVACARAGQPGAESGGTRPQGERVTIS
jgi:hypothetical protein